MKIRLPQIGSQREHLDCSLNTFEMRLGIRWSRKGHEAEDPAKQTNLRSIDPGDYDLLDYKVCARLLERMLNVGLVFPSFALPHLGGLRYCSSRPESKDYRVCRIALAVGSAFQFHREKLKLTTCAEAQVREGVCLIPR